MRKGDLAGAERVLSKLNSQPAGRSMPGLLLYSHVLEVQRKIPQAVAALEAAETRARQPWEKTKILNKAADLLGARQEASQAEVEKAVAFLERSVAIDSQRGNAAARRNLCALYYRLKNYEAVDLHAGLLVEVPEFATRARLWLASACFFLDEKSRGVPHLSAAATDAAALNDGDLTWLLQMLMNYRLHDEAQEVIDEALAAGREGPALSRTRAQLYYERRDFARVLEVLPEAAQPGVGEDAESRQSALFLRGRSLDALGRYAEAHECFVAMNDVARNAYPAPIAPDFAAAWGGVDLAGLPAYELPASVPYVPTFMVAFPRSGTTLLDTILDTQREIATLSEVESVMAARSAMTATGRAYPRDLGRLSRQDVDRLRKVYFDYNAPVLDSYGTFSVLVDKLPLNILHVPFMKMLFPDARFILSLRHPLDVCLSCFQQGFQLNDEMLHFTDLPGTFRRYRDVMTAFLNFRETLEIRLLTVRYEDLVGRFEETAAAVFEFLGVSADDSYRNFYRINREKLLATPSRDQVVQPLYASSRYRWRNYAEILEPHVDLVRPLIERFGYAEEEA